MCRNAPVTPEGRLRLSRIIAEGWPMVQLAGLRVGNFSDRGWGDLKIADTRTRAALNVCLYLYNYHRQHTAISGPPVSRVNNLVGQNS